VGDVGDADTLRGRLLLGVLVLVDFRLREASRTRFFASSRPNDLSLNSLRLILSRRACSYSDSLYGAMVSLFVG